jgi:hypothetical protein
MPKNPFGFQWQSLRKFASEKALNRLICLASNGSSEYLADSMLEAAPENSVNIMDL